MIKLKLKIKDSNEIELERRDAICNFCGQERDNCIKGSLPSSFERTVYSLEYKRVPDDGNATRYCRKEGRISSPIFGKPKLLEDGEYGYFYTDPVYKNVVNDSKTETVVKDIDICYDCITQLSKLIK